MTNEDNVSTSYSPLRELIDRCDVYMGHILGLADSIDKPSLEDYAEYTKFEKLVKDHMADIRNNIFRQYTN